MLLAEKKKSKISLSLPTIHFEPSQKIIISSTNKKFERDYEVRLNMPLEEQFFEATLCSLLIPWAKRINMIGDSGNTYQITLFVLRKGDVTRLTKTKKEPDVIHPMTLFKKCKLNHKEMRMRERKIEITLSKSFDGFTLVIMALWFLSFIEWIPSYVVPTISCICVPSRRKSYWGDRGLEKSSFYCWEMIFKMIL